jgi:uncharacterized protein involved in exopolysaccharide biosynthesis
MMVQRLRKMLRDFLAKRKGLVCLPLILALTTGVFTACSKTQWTARAVLEFPPLPSSLDFVQAMDQASTIAGGAMASLTGGGEPLKRYIGILQSERVRRRLLERPGLAKPLTALLRGETQPGMLRALQGIVKFSIQPGQMLAVQATLPGPSKVAMLVGHQSPEEAKKTAAALAKACADELQYYLENVSASHERSQLKYLTPQVEASYRRLLRLQARQLALRRAGKGLFPKEESPLLAAALGSLLTDRAAASVELAAAERGIATAAAELKRVPQQVLGGTQLTKNPEIDRLRALLTDADMRYYVLTNTEGKSARHPEVRQELDTIRQLEDKLSAVLRQPLAISTKQMARNAAYDGLQQNYLTALVGKATAQAKVVALERLQSSSLAKMQGLGDRSFEQIRLEADYQLESAMYTLLRTTLEQVKIRQQLVAQSFVVLDAPEPPDRKSGPSLVKNMALAFFLGILLIVVYLELERQLNLNVSKDASGDQLPPITY